MWSRKRRLLLTFKFTNIPWVGNKLLYSLYRYPYRRILYLNTNYIVELTVHCETHYPFCFPQDAFTFATCIATKICSLSLYLQICRNFNHPTYDTFRFVCPSPWFFSLSLLVRIIWSLSHWMCASISIYALWRVTLINSAIQVSWRLCRVSIRTMT